MELNTDHDTAFAEAMKTAKQTYTHLETAELHRLLNDARNRYASDGPTHEATAATLIIYEELKRRNAV